MRKTSRRRKRGAARRQKEGEGGWRGLPVDGEGGGALAVGEGRWRGPPTWGGEGEWCGGRMHRNTKVRGSDLLEGAGK